MGEESYISIRHKQIAQIWTVSPSLSQTRGCNTALYLHLKGHSHFDLFINGCRKVELGKGLPFF